MAQIDLIYIFQWWFLLFSIGIISLPITTRIFSSFSDKGYIFSKILGIGVISYLIFLTGMLHLSPFTRQTSLVICLLWLGINSIIARNTHSFLQNVTRSWKIFLFEEILLIGTLTFWSFIRSQLPEIHGLEKFMDFGFVNSIARSEYFPPLDMWFPPLSINYYYFGHMITAILTKLSAIPSFITYNLMIATLFAFTATASFSLGYNLFLSFSLHTKIKKKLFFAATSIGLLSAFLVSCAGNLQTIYTLFKPYVNEHPVPFWNLPLFLQDFPNSYWYPNATRFISHTIHEFPIYSFVVSDLHGHVLDIPFVLCTIAILFSFFIRTTKPHPLTTTTPFITLTSFLSLFWKDIVLLGFLTGIMYMTNALDGPIYFLLIAFSLLYSHRHYALLIRVCIILAIGVCAYITSFPFSHFFIPFASGLGVLCIPVSQETHLGPFLFEPGHCEHSPLWQLMLLYGFFYTWVAFFLIFLWKKQKIYPADIFVLLLAVVSTLLIIIPELVYIKDIYSGHYRANTMFKLVYEAFIQLSLASAYMFGRLSGHIKEEFFTFSLKRRFFLFLFTPFVIFLYFLISIYPYFAIVSFYGSLNKPSTLNGITYLQTLYPDYYHAIEWINKNIHGQPVILEAQGDSYKDFALLSVNTGLPTVLGWTVHEWLWRGTYDIVAPRITDIKTMYESPSVSLTTALLKKYHVVYVALGDVERQQYPQLAEDKFKKLGKVVYTKGALRIYKIY